MADNSGGNSMGLLGVLIGAILMIGVGYFMFVGSSAVKPTGTNVTIEAPKPAPAPTPAPVAR